MSVPSRRLGLRRLVECAVLIAIGTVLSLFEFSGPWALGGGITVCSMLPLVLICHRHGTKWGICSALVYGVLQMFLGMKNVMYGRNFWEVLAIILLDYVVAFGVIGRWDGERTGISSFETFDDLMNGDDSPFKDCEIDHIWDENGILKMRGHHHDGSVEVEIRQDCPCDAPALVDLWKHRLRSRYAESSAD